MSHPFKFISLTETPEQVEAQFHETVDRLRRLQAEKNVPWTKMMQFRAEFPPEDLITLDALYTLTSGYSLILLLKRARDNLQSYLYNTHFTLHAEQFRAWVTQIVDAISNWLQWVTEVVTAPRPSVLHMNKMASGFTFISFFITAIASPLPECMRLLRVAQSQSASESSAAAAAATLQETRDGLKRALDKVYWNSYFKCVHCDSAVGDSSKIPAPPTCTNTTCPCEIRCCVDCFYNEENRALRYAPCTQCNDENTIVNMFIT